MTSPAPWQWRYAQPGPYQTPLSPEEEARFRYWIQANRVPFNPNNLASDYDMRGFWKALQAGDPRATTAINPVDQRMHFPDVWKTPYHQSFSNQSQYALPNAPHWNDQDQLIDANGNVVFDERANEAALKTRVFLPTGISMQNAR